MAIVANDIGPVRYAKTSASTAQIKTDENTIQCRCVR